MPIPKPTYIYRITHYSNVPWILDHGLHCRTSPTQDPNFVNIGNRDLIDKRAMRIVGVPPGGVLNDYVPFYFCTHSVMLFNIHTGRVEGVNVKQEDVVYLVSSIEELQNRQLAFAFTDRHAYVQGARYYNDPVRLAALDWPLIHGRDFKRDPNDPGKLERRAAECLVHRHLPIEAVLHVACKDVERENFLHEQVKLRHNSTKVLRASQWYF